MPVPNGYLDGTMQYGTSPVTINAVTYILNNISVDRPSTEAKDQNSVGSDQRRRVTATNPTLSAELQLATSSTTRPKFGDTFSVTLDSNYGSETWALDPVNYEADNGPGNIRVVKITAQKVINGSVTTF